DGGDGAGTTNSPRQMFACLCHGGWGVSSAVMAAGRDPGKRQGQSLLLFDIKLFIDAWRDFSYPIFKEESRRLIQFRLKKFGYRTKSSTFRLRRASNRSIPLPTDRGDGYYT